MWAEVSWKGNWIPFLDNPIHPLALNTVHRHLRVPKEIEKVAIDPKEFLQHVDHEQQGQEREGRCIEGILGCPLTSARNPPSIEDSDWELKCQYGK